MVSFYVKVGKLVYLKGKSDYSCFYEKLMKCGLYFHSDKYHRGCLFRNQSVLKLQKTKKKTKDVESV